MCILQRDSVGSTTWNTLFKDGVPDTRSSGRGEVVTKWWKIVADASDCSLDGLIQEKPIEPDNYCHHTVPLTEDEYLVMFLDGGLEEHMLIHANLDAARHKRRETQ